MLADFKVRAERKVRAGLLFGAIAKAEKIEVAEADVEKHLLALAERSGKHIAKVRADHQGEERRNLELQLLEKKLLEYLKAQATIRDVDAKPEAEEADDSSGQDSDSTSSSEAKPKSKSKKAKK
jgi:FKBP-type peptidyl-prolyl cis-trans isomerase (trigger factor)